MSKIKKILHSFITFLCLLPIFFAFFITVLYPIGSYVFHCFFQERVIEEQITPISDVYTQENNEIKKITVTHKKLDFLGAKKIISLLDNELFFNAFSNVMHVWFYGGVIVFIFAFIIKSYHNQNSKFYKINRLIISLPSAIFIGTLAAVFVYFIFNNKYGIISIFADVLNIEALKDYKPLSTENINFYLTLSFSLCNIALFAFFSPVLGYSFALPIWTSTVFASFIFTNVFSPRNATNQTVMISTFLINSFTDETDFILKETNYSAIAMIILLSIITSFLVSYLLKNTFYVPFSQKLQKVNNKPFYKHKINKILCGFFIVLSSFFVLFCVIWVIGASLSNTKDIFSGKIFSFSQGLNFTNYLDAIETLDLAEPLTNTFFYGIISATLTVFLALPASYKLARSRFVGNIFVRFLFTLSFCVPQIISIPPLLDILQKIYFLNEHIKLILIYVLKALPFCTICLTAAISTKPSEKEITRLSLGASKIKVFFVVFIKEKILLILSTIGMYFVIFWNDFVTVKIMSNIGTFNTISTKLLDITNTIRYNGNWELLFATIVIASILPIIVFVLCASHFFKLKTPPTNI